MADAPTAMGAMGSDDECFFVIRPQVSRMMPWPRPLLPEPTDESPPPPSFVTESKSATSPKPTTTQKDKKPPPKTTEKKTKTTTTSEDSSTDRAIFTAIETTGSSGSISSSGSSSDSGASNGSATKTTSPEKETPVTPNIQFSPSTTEMLSPTLSSKSWSSGYGGGDEWLTGSTSLPSMATPTPGVTTTSCVGAPWHGLGDRDNEPAKGTSSSKTIEAALGTIGGCALAVVLIAVLILRRRHQKRRVGMMEDEEDEAHDLGNGAVVDEKAAMSAEARSNSTMTRATAGNTPIPLSLLDTPVPLASETGSGRVLADFRASLVPISVPPPAAIANDLHPGVGVSGTTSARSPLLYHQHGSGSTDSSRMTYSMSSKHSQASSVVRKYWAASMAARAERLTQEGQSLQHAYQDAAGVLHNGGITVGGDRTPSFGRDEEDDEGSRDSESRMADILRAGGYWQWDN
ncbi:hypothetical protein BGW38_006473 [Lunasporangiospora selenospora]|uniref:Uncharacterized protein n=1 Tax=Lunasporangiospora selenospora TaxID=979761 RepID=A0A9P6KAP9_9FUNG|nr:hypothetical protein BGW38_006473 [Lunasporangiospora selenospora]